MSEPSEAIPADEYPQQLRVLGTLLEQAGFHSKWPTLVRAIADDLAGGDTNPEPVHDRRALPEPDTTPGNAFNQGYRFGYNDAHNGIPWRKHEANPWENGLVQSADYEPSDDELAKIYAFPRGKHQDYSPLGLPIYVEGIRAVFRAGVATHNSNDSNSVYFKSGWDSALKEVALHLEPQTRPLADFMAEQGFTVATHNTVSPQGQQTAWTVEQFEEWSNEVAVNMSERWDGEEGQEALIESFMAHYGKLDQLLAGLDYDNDYPVTITLDSNDQWALLVPTSKEND